MSTFYPGIGADKAISELHGLVGEITATWAEVEDGLCLIFIVAVAGTLRIDVRPYRAVFFTFSSYEGKMRMTHNAMKTRYSVDENITAEWDALRSDMNGFAKLRNEIAHLSPVAKGSPDPAAAANVRLVPPFWRKAFQEADFNELGYSASQLGNLLRPYWGFNRRFDREPPTGEAPPALGYRIQQFALKLSPLVDSEAQQANR